MKPTRRRIEVTHAVLSGDREAQSKFGKRGAAVRKKNAAKRKAEAEVLSEYHERLRTYGSYQMMRQANEHICPID